MRSRRCNVATFDDLIESRYGKPDTRLLRGTENAEELFTSYYGKLPEHRNGEAKPAVMLSIYCDDGKTVLAQRNRFFDGYDSARSALKAALPEKTYRRIKPLEMPAEEVLPLPARAAAPPLPQPLAPAPAASAGPAPQRGSPPSAAQPAPVASEPAPATAAAASRYSAADRTAASPTEEDFLADMRSISTGQSVYDPVTKKTVRKEELKEYKRDADPAHEAFDRSPPPEPGESQKIFERIAKSMQYAEAFDLGTVDLENRFADFDRIDEIQKKTATDKKARPKPQAKIAESSGGVKPGPAEFLQDLDAIKKQAENVVTAVQPEVTREASVPDRYSVPLYDTGEHVLAGGDLYRDQLLVGKAPGVLFSYGEIIAMADLFESVDQMMAEDTAVLRNLKRLIDQSFAYYNEKVTKGIEKPSLMDVTQKQWRDATGGRYLELAKDNYAHFAPNFLYKNEAFARNANRYSNHREAWEQHHGRAINAAQEMALDPANANVSYVPVWPLIINAFGDHFLTDAFSAGHVINKEAVIEHFKSMFYSGESLTPDAEQFFERLAEKAWYGDVAAKFQKLETVGGAPVPAWGYLLSPIGAAIVHSWHPDIKNAERFGKVLKGIAEKQPDEIANLAVKAVHDVLNRDGIDVLNEAGAHWKLTGDEHLTRQTLAVMSQAVKVSAGTITDPSILRSNLNLSSYFAKVWAYVPKLTPASETKVKNLLTTYVSPKSTQLIGAAEELIRKQVDLLIKELIDKKALQPI